MPKHFRFCTRELRFETRTLKNKPFLLLFNIIVLLALIYLFSLIPIKVKMSLVFRHTRFRFYLLSLFQFCYFFLFLGLFFNFCFRLSTLRRRLWGGWSRWVGSCGAWRGRWWRPQRWTTERAPSYDPWGKTWRPGKNEM